MKKDGSEIKKKMFPYQTPTLSNESCVHFDNI